MGSHHTGFDELIYIQTPEMTLTVKGQASHPSVPGVVFSEKESELWLDCSGILEEFGINADYEEISAVSFGNVTHRKYKLSPLFFEQQRYELIIEPSDGREVEFWHENYNIRKNITATGRSKTLLTGEINFGNDIGYSDLYIKVDGRDYLKLTIEVFPSKISYKEDYKAIIADVTGEVYSLVFDFLKKTYESFDVSSSKQSSPVEFFAIIQKIYKEYISAADMILRNPHHQLLTDHEILPWYKIKQTDGSTIRWLEKHPQNVVQNHTGNSLRCYKALAVKKHVTYDTKENRLTKYMLLQTAVKLDSFRKSYCRIGNADEVVIENITKMINSIQRRVNTGFMREVTATAGNSGMSLVFSMAPGYREIYKYYLLLQHGLSISGSLFNLSVKDIAVLYEYWCFIKLNSLMKRKYQLLSLDIIRTSGNGLYLALRKGTTSRVKYLNPKTGEKIVLSYNPSKQNLPTISQKPDTILRLEKHGSSTDYEFVFDAKYRINPAEPGSDYYNTIAKTPGPEIDTINIMHRYRDAIVYQNEATPYERTMFGAYVLFPYHNEEEYKNHRFYKSIDQVNIGGLPFLPSATSLVEKQLDELITDSSESAFERATLPIGIESKLAKVEWNKRDVLVVSVKSSVAFEEAFSTKRIIIPTYKLVGNPESINEIAIYQIKSAFGADAGIKYYGIVIGISKCVCDEVDSYEFTLKAWKSLNRAIEPREGGRDIILTNKFLLEHSSQVLELTLRTKEEYRFYSELKRRTDAQVINNEDTPGNFIVGDYTIVFEDGKIHLLENEHIRGACLISEFAKKPNQQFRRLMSYMKQSL